MNSMNNEEQFIKNFNVKKIVCLLDSKLLFGMGHTSIMFVDNVGRGIYYGTSRIEDGYHALKGEDAAVKMNKVILTKEQVDNVFIIGKLPEPQVKKNFDTTMATFIDALFRFDKYISFPISYPSEGMRILDKAEEIYKNPKKYNMYERNCNHMIQEILAAIHLDFSPLKGAEAEIFKKQIENFQMEIRRFEYESAKKTLKDGVKQCHELCITPVGAFEKGINMARERGFKYGQIKLPNEQCRQFYKLAMSKEKNFIGKVKLEKFRNFYNKNKLDMNNYQRFACEKFILRQISLGKKCEGIEENYKNYKATKLVKIVFDSKKFIVNKSNTKLEMFH